MTFYDASTDPELAAEAAVLAEIVRAADAIGVEVLVIGAVARDILIRHVLGARPERATRDVDVAVAVANWPAYDRLTSSLRRSGGVSHRFVVHGVDVDIIPFGGVESPGGPSPGRTRWRWMSTASPRPTARPSSCTSQAACMCVSRRWPHSCR